MLKLHHHFWERCTAPPPGHPVTSAGLDVPSSGLILVAKTYGAYFDLRLQLQTGCSDALRLPVIEISTNKHHEASARA